MEIEKLEKTIGEIAEKLEKSNFADKSEITALQTELKTLNEKLVETSGLETEIATLKEQMQKSDIAISEAIRNMQRNSKQEESIKEKLLKTIKTDLLPELKKSYDAKTLGYFPVVSKQSTTASFGAGILPEERDPEVSYALLPIEDEFLQLCNVANSTSHILEWTNRSLTAGGAAATDEGDPKANVDFEWTRGEAPFSKTSIYHRTSEEALNDYNMLFNEINTEVIQRLDNVTMARLLTDAHVAGNMLGLLAYAQPLDLVALQNTIAVDVYREDSIIASATQIYLNTQRRANGVLINPVDALVMKTFKDAIGAYIEVPFKNASGVITRIDTLRVIENQNIPAGSYLVGDFSRFNVRFRLRNDIRVGFNGNDFRENFISILGENRVGCYVKLHDVEAFVYETFENARAWLLIP